MIAHNRLNKKTKIIIACAAIIISFEFFFTVDALGRFKNFYQSCIYGSVVADNGGEEILSVYPINQNCATGCDASCKAAFSSKVQIGPTDFDTSKMTREQIDATNLELNDSLIYDCISTCQKGESFSAWALTGTAAVQTTSEGNYYLPTSQYNTKFSSSEKVASCMNAPTDPDGAKALDTDGKPIPNDFIRAKTQNYGSDEITISINDTDETENIGKVYMCGRKSVTLTPVFPNIYHIYPTVVEGGDSTVLPDLPGTRNKYYDYSANGFQKSIMDSMVADWNGGEETYIKPTPNYDCRNLSHDACVKELNDILVKGVQAKGEWSQSCFSDLPGQMHCLSGMTSHMNTCATNLYYPPKCTKKHSSGGSNYTEGTKDFLDATQVCLGKKIDSGTADKSPPQAWELNSQQKAINMVVPRRTHPCFVGLSDEQWNNLTNKDIFNYYKTHNKQQYFSPLDADGKPIDLNIVKRVNCFWDYHVRSDIPTKTGVFYRKGDDINIGFLGGVIVSADSATFLDYKSAVMDFFAKSTNQKTDIQRMSMMNFKLDGSWRQISAERLRREQDQEILAVCGSNTYFGNEKEDGFDSFISQRTVESVTSGKDPIINPDKNTKLPCDYVTRPGQGLYKISAVNQETYISQPSERNEIEIQHPEFDKAGYPVRLGGFQVKIDWGGCPILAGDRLQIAYTVGIPRSKDWVDLNFNDTAHIKERINNEYSIKIIPKKFFSGIGNYAIGSISDHDSRYLYFRIKPFPQEGSSANSIAMFSINNRFGHYDIKVHTNHIPMPSGGPLYDLVRSVDRVLFGDDHAQYHPGDPGYQEHNKGVIKNLFSNVVVQTRYIRIINVMLILFVILSAMIFLIGLSQLDAREGLKRVLKIGCVATMISPTSWEFFGVHIVGMFVDGTLGIIQMIVGNQYIAQTMHIDFNNDKFAVFAMFQSPITIIFSGDNTLRLLAVLLSSVFGIVLVCIIIISSVIYIAALVKATVFFVFCLMVESLLIILSPITIPMILFEQTKQITIKWFKQLISYALQPIFLFSALALFNTMMLIVIQSVFGFTICPKCIIAIPLPIFNDICLIPGYGTIEQMHYPQGIETTFAFPIATLVASLLFAAIGHMMWVLGEISAEIISTLVTGQASSSSVASSASQNFHSTVVDAGRGAVNTAVNLAKTSWQMSKNAVSGMRDSGRILNESEAKKSIREKNEGIKNLASKIDSLDKQLKESDVKQESDKEGDAKQKDDI